MASKKITFDPTAGVPYAANLTIFGGANFSADFTVVDTGNAAYNFTGWTGSAQLAKSVSVGATMGALATFNVGFTSAAGGKFKLTLTAGETRSLSEGRYVYNVLVSSGATIYNIVNGNVLVYAGISSVP